MPHYDYHCTANGHTLEVKHRMSETVATWGELCALAGIATDATPADSPVVQVISAAFVAGGSSSSRDAGPAAPSGHRHTAMCNH
ncbi:MAG: zinc ribbon domain-containing protein [Gammaproteobacteria bacterium]|nr:zinc ribbon domain-containing protein [Gammaproteobacteria bacterium]